MTSATRAQMGTHSHWCTGSAYTCSRQLCALIHVTSYTTLCIPVCKLSETADSQLLCSKGTHPHGRVRAGRQGMLCMCACMCVDLHCYFMLSAQAAMGTWSAWRGASWHSTSRTPGGLVHVYVHVNRIPLLPHAQCKCFIGNHEDMERLERRIVAEYNQGAKGLMHGCMHS